MLENISKDAVEKYNLDRLLLKPANSKLQQVYQRSTYGFVKSTDMLDRGYMVKYLTRSGRSKDEGAPEAAAKQYYGTDRVSREADVQSAVKEAEAAARHFGIDDLDLDLHEPFGHRQLPRKSPRPLWWPIKPAPRSTGPSVLPQEQRGKDLSRLPSPRDEIPDDLALFLEENETQDIDDDNRLQKRHRTDATQGTGGRKRTIQQNTFLKAAGVQTKK
jgi:hypothetical protein